MNTYLPNSAERRVVVLYNKALHLRFDNHIQAILKISAEHAEASFSSAVKLSPWDSEFARDVVPSVLAYNPWKDNS